ncbi:MAG: LolA family protein [Candidatus Acidiferrales bacterium]
MKSGIMRSVVTVVILCAMLAGSTAHVRAASQAKTNWTLDEVLKAIDRESRSFQSLTANIERTKVTVVVNDTSTETGHVWMRRDNKMRIELAPPDARTVLVTGNTLYLHNPGLKRVEEFDLGKHRTQLDKFLFLGFGTSAGDLKGDYIITLQGESALDQRKVLLLELTPKKDEVRTHFSRIHLWIDLATWVPMQQRLFETGSGDHTTIRYTNVQRNASIPDARFRPNWPRETTKIKRQ